MKWYDYVFGGSKAFQAFTAMVLGFWAFMTMGDARPAHIWELFLFLTACAGIYGFYRIKEYKVKNGNGNNNA